MNLFGATIAGSIIGAFLGILLSPLLGIGFLVGWAIGGFIAGILAKGAGRGFFAGFLMCIIGPIIAFLVFSTLGMEMGTFTDIPYLDNIMATFGGALAISLFAVLFISSLCCSGPAGLVGGAIVGKPNKKPDEKSEYATYTTRDYIIKPEEEKRTCLNCGRLYPAEYNICPYCGTTAGSKKDEIEGKRACLNCGRLYPAEYNICPYCGTTAGSKKDEINEEIDEQDGGQLNE